MSIKRTKTTSSHRFIGYNNFKKDQQIARNNQGKNL